jgi:hypothetical protein
MPLQEFATGSLGPAIWYRDRLPSLRVKLLAIAELIAKAGAHHQPVPRVHSEVTTVEQSMHI